MTMILLVALFLIAGLSAMDIYVAPVLYVDETADNTRNTNKVQHELITALRTAETGVNLQFDLLKKNDVNPPVSLFDAMTVCQNERIEYLLYGYVTKRTHNVSVEIRLYEYSSRVIIQSFFGMDDNEHYDRLIEDIAMKVLDCVRERFNLDIILKRPSITRLMIPVIVGYWTPLENDWIRVMLGTVSAGTGLTLIPTDNLFMIRGTALYLSIGLEVKYRLGIGNPSRYEVRNHTLYMMMPLRLHISLTSRHQIYTGLGYVYFLEFFSFADKYDDVNNYMYNNMGVNAGIGYRFQMTPNLSIFFRNDFDFLFNERSLITYSPMIGLDIQIYNKEIKKRW
jgi:TolB-like protein